MKANTTVPSTTKTAELPEERKTPLSFAMFSEPATADVTPIKPAGRNVDPVVATMGVAMTPQQMEAWYAENANLRGVFYNPGSSMRSANHSVTQGLEASPAGQPTPDVSPAPANARLPNNDEDDYLPRR